ncbi:MAG: hypothetical protein JRH08_11595 [Deltaproteobacteria bacterium]|nr:hypothetical protein [Deltaproteobacteria bacterium]
MKKQERKTQNWVIAGEDDQPRLVILSVPHYVGEDELKDLLVKANGGVLLDWNRRTLMPVDEEDLADIGWHQALFYDRLRMLASL